MADSVDNNFYVSESLTVGSLEDKMYSQRTLSAHFARSTGAKVDLPKKNRDSNEEQSKIDRLVEKKVHKVVTQLIFSQFCFPYFKDKNGKALSGKKVIKIE
jgi:hypothetical protein